MELENVKEYLEELAVKVAEDLFHIYSHCDQATPYGLVFPRYRNGSLRISEQESKLLFARHILLDQKYRFSVETPTVKTYRQKGTRDMSARVDLTLVGCDGQPSAHIELKAHHDCSVENIRKDLEKLIREDSIGLWFHTLERGDGGCLEILLNTFRMAFERLSDHLRVGERSYLICFCVLETRVLFWRWLHFTGNEAGNLSAIQNVFEARSVSGGNWQQRGVESERANIKPNVYDGGRPVNAAARGKGAREGFFVFAPSIAADTFLHLSVRGGSYRIRNFHEDGPTMSPLAWTVPGYASFEALRASGLIAQWLPVTSEDCGHSLIAEPAHWYERIRSVNARGLPATS